MLRIGIIGAGKMALWHARAYRRIPNVSLAAIANPTSDRGERLAARFGIPAHFRDAHRMIDEADVDAIDVCVPTEFHREYVLHALRSGRHVYCEKPLCGTAADAADIVEANRSAKRIVFNGFNYRFMPEFLRFAGPIRAEKLGALRYVRFLRTTEETETGYRHGLGRGVFSDFHCHFVDLLFSFGFPDPTKVFAFGTSLSDGSESPDTGTMILKFEDRSVAEISTSVVVPGLTAHALAVGTKGSVRLDYGKVRYRPLTRRRGLAASVAGMFCEAMTIPWRVLRNPFAGSCAHFVRCATEALPCECDETAALRVLRVTDVAHASFEQGGRGILLP